MSTKHTPGPWSLRKTSRTNNFGIYAASGHLLAGVDVHRLATEALLKRREADARLIASAPELLEALQECMSDADSYEERSGKKLVGGWPAKARAAIAKATGEQA